MKVHIILGRIHHFGTSLFGTTMAIWAFQNQDLFWNLSMLRSIIERLLDKVLKENILLILIITSHFLRHSLVILWLVDTFWVYDRILGDIDRRLIEWIIEVYNLWSPIASLSNLCFLNWSIIESIVRLKPYVMSFNHIGRESFFMNV